MLLTLNFDLLQMVDGRKITVNYATKPANSGGGGRGGGMRGGGRGGGKNIFM